MRKLLFAIVFMIAAIGVCWPWTHTDDRSMGNLGHVVPLRLYESDGTEITAGWVTMCQTGQDTNSVDATVFKLRSQASGSSTIWTADEPREDIYSVYWDETKSGSAILLEERLWIAGKTAGLGHVADSTAIVQEIIGTTRIKDGSVKYADVDEDWALNRTDLDGDNDEPVTMGWVLSQGYSAASGNTVEQITDAIFDNDGAIEAGDELSTADIEFTYDDDGDNVGTVYGSIIDETIMPKHLLSGATAYSDYDLIMVGQLALPNYEFDFLGLDEILVGGDDINVSVASGVATINYDGSTSGLTQEQVQDYVGPMVIGNTETGITVEYDDGSNEFDFVVEVGSSEITDDDVALIDLASEADGVSGSAYGSAIDKDIMAYSSGVVSYLDIDDLPDYIDSYEKWDDNWLSDRLISDQNGLWGITVVYDDTQNDFDFLATGIDGSNVTDNSLGTDEIKSTNYIVTDPPEGYIMVKADPVSADDAIRLG